MSLSGLPKWGNDWMASWTRWNWVWTSSGRWWWTGKPGMLESMGWQRVRHDWATELNWASQTVPVVKNLPVNSGGLRDARFFPGCGRSPGGGHGNPLQYSCLENPKDRGQSTGSQKVGHDWSDWAHMHTHTHVVVCRRYLLKYWMSITWFQIAEQKPRAQVVPTPK